MDGEARFERCLPDSPCAPLPSKIFAFSMEGAYFPIFLSGLRSRTRTANFYKNSQSSYGFSKEKRVETDNISGRHFNFKYVKRARVSGLGSSDLVTSASGFYY